MNAKSSSDSLDGDTESTRPNCSSQPLNSPRKRIRLALVSDQFEMGGLERCMAALVNELPESEIQPMVIAFGGQCEASKWINQKNVEVISLGKSFPNDPRLALRLASELRRRKITMVHSHNWGSLMESGIASRICGIPHVHAEHGLEFSQNAKGWRSRIKPILKRKLFRNANALIAIADCVKQRFVDVYGIESHRVTLIPNGVAKPIVGDRQQNYCELRQRLDLPQDAIIAGTIGRAAHVKGFDNAIRAFQRIAKQSQKHHLVIVGGGSEIERLRDLSVQLSINDQVHLVGHQLDIGFWLSGFDLFFNSSRSEAMNLGIIEAMAVGLPIVAMDVGDNAIMINKHGKCGIIVEQGNLDKFSESLLNVLGDRSLANELGSRSQEVYEGHYTVAHMADAYMSLYKRTLEAHPRGATIGLSEHR